MEEQTGVVTGWRYWRITADGQLLSANNDFLWTPQYAAVAVPSQIGVLGLSLFRIAVGLFGLAISIAWAVIASVTDSWTWDTAVWVIVFPPCFYWGVPFILWLTTCRHGQNDMLCNKNPGCGIYAYEGIYFLPHSFIRLVRFFSPRTTFIGGNVSMWGQVAIHKSGFRSTLAYPASFDVISCAYCHVLVDFSEVGDNQGFASCPNCLDNPKTPNGTKVPSLCTIYGTKASFSA